MNGKLQNNSKCCQIIIFSPADFSVKLFAKNRSFFPWSVFASVGDVFDRINCRSIHEIGVPGDQRGGQKHGGHKNKKHFDSHSVLNKLRFFLGTPLLVFWRRQLEHEIIWEMAGLCLTGVAGMDHKLNATTLFGC